MSRWFPQLDEDGNVIGQSHKRAKTSERDIQDLLQETVGRALGAQVLDKDGMISYDWTDPKTGLTYTVREKPAKGPEGDFRVSSVEHEQRYKTLMGQQKNELVHKARGEILHAEPSLEDSDVFQAMQESRRQKSEAVHRAKKMNAWTVHREKMSDELLDEDDRRILEKPDVPANRTGLNETRRPSGPTYTTNLRGRSDESIHIPKERQGTLPDMGTYAKNVAFEPIHIEKALLTRDTLQSAYASAFRGIFGADIADHLVQASTSDKKPRNEVHVIVHHVVDQGLVEGPSQASTTEEARRKDTLAYHLGRRAIEGLTSKQSVPEYTRLPLAQRDLVALAVGRTLQALTEGPKQASELLESARREDRLLEDIHQVQPNLYGPKLSSDVVVSTRAAQHVGLLHSSAQSRSVSGPQHAGLGTEIAENRRQVQKLPVLLKLQTSAEQSNHEPSIHEASRRSEALLKDLLSKPVLTSDVIQSILKPEIIRVTQKEDHHRNDRVANAQLVEDLRASTEMIVSPHRRGRDDIEGPMVLPAYELQNRNSVVPSSQTKRDLQIEILDDI